MKQDEEQCCSSSLLRVMLLIHPAQAGVQMQDQLLNLNDVAGYSPAQERRTASRS